MENYVKYPRFVKEFVNHQIREISGNESMNSGLKAEKIRRIRLYERALHRGIITVDEAMRHISLPIKYEEDETRFFT